MSDEDQNVPTADEPAENTQENTETEGQDTQEEQSSEE